MGLEPTISAWKANVLPLHYIRTGGAGDGARTRHLRLGKAALYQMSYSRILKTTIGKQSKQPDRLPMVVHPQGLEPWTP